MRREQIEEIKAKIPIETIVARYIPVKRGKACCPFHPDKSPSLSIHPKKRIWKCFGCGKGGDVFKFVQLIEGIDFKNAVVLLAKEAGVKPARSKRFQAYLGRRDIDKKEKLATLATTKKIIERTYVGLIDRFQSVLHRLPPKDSWDSWDSRHYLIEQLVEYKYDVLDRNHKKIDGVINKIHEEIIKDGRISDTKSL